jgi:hypothetical protein
LLIDHGVLSSLCLDSETMKTKFKVSTKVDTYLFSYLKAFLPQDG